MRKRCTYMAVTVAFAAPGAEAGDEDEDDAYVQLMGQVLGEVMRGVSLLSPPSPG